MVQGGSMYKGVMQIMVAGHPQKENVNERQIKLILI